MEADFDPNIIKETQTSLGKYVKRPPLSDKLLKKPPFRFLHDIVTSVLKSTGFFSGLFDESELISENVKDREAKILFLNKIIFVIGQTTGKQLFVKPSKIVAGQEPEKTNELLQCLALALDKKLTSDAAVNQFKQEKGASKGVSVTKGPVATNAKVDSKKSRAKSIDRTTKNDKNQGQTTKSKLKETVKIKKETSPKNISQHNKVKSKEKSEKTIKELKESIVTDLNHSSNHDVATDDSSDINLKEKTQIKYVDEHKHDDFTSADINQSLNSESKTTISTSGTSPVPTPKSNEFTDLITSDEKAYVSNEENNQIEKNTLNSKCIEKHEESLKVDTALYKEKLEEDTTKHRQKSSGTLDRSDSQNVENSNIRPSSTRPTSSRPGAPRVRDRHENNILPAGNINIIGKVNIISENSLPEEDEESSIVIENNTNFGTLSEQPVHASENQHGHLVQQILDSQKEFTHVSGKTEIEWQFEAQKARDDINKDIEQLCFNIQALSRIANPLGKLLEHIQEDVEVMRQESQQWIQTYEETSKELSKQKSLNEELLLPLHSKIKQLEAEIMEKQDKISDLKIIVYKNNTRIEKLLANGNAQ